MNSSNADVQGEPELVHYPVSQENGNGLVMPPLWRTFIMYVAVSNDFKCIESFKALTPKHNYVDDSRSLLGISTDNECEYSVCCCGGIVRGDD